MPLVFVYGTLLRDGANHALLATLANARLLGEASTKAPHTLVDLGPYPALLSPGAHASFPTPLTCVRGEVWEVDDRGLRTLDDFEDCPELYERQRIRVVLAGREGREREEDVFTYVFTRRLPAGARVIEAGQYAATTRPSDGQT